MSLKHKFKNPDGIYFTTFSVVGWIEVFTRNVYKDILVDSLNWCIKNKGLEVYAWVVMTNHIHLIVSRKGDPKLEDIFRDLKKFTSVKILDEIRRNAAESRKEWILDYFKKRGHANSQNENQFWQHGNHPVELSSNLLIDQKMTYLHNNPVMAGFVSEPHFWKYSSAMDYAGLKGYVNIEKLI